MIDDKKREPLPEAEPDEPKVGNSIVQAAYSAALFSDQGESRDEEKETKGEEAEVG